MNPAFLLLAALLLPAFPAMAGNWHILQNNPQMLLEAGEPQLEENTGNGQDNIKKKDKTLKVWSKSTYSRPEQARPGDFYYASAKSLLAINCTKHSYRLLQKIYYAADGQEIKSVHYGQDERNESIVPDSAEERVFDFSCGFKFEKVDNKSPKRAKLKPAVAAEKSVTAEKTSQPGTGSQKSGGKAASKDIKPAPEKTRASKSKDSEAAPSKH